MATRSEVRNALERIRALELERNVVGLSRELDNPTERGGRGQARAQAADALGRVGDARAVPYLLAFANDPSERVRGAVINALAEMQATEAKPAFLAALNDPDKVVRMSAAFGLGRIGATESARKLEAVLRADKDGWVRVYAAEALAAIGDDSFADVIGGELSELRALPWWKRKRGRLRRWQQLLERQSDKPAPGEAPHRAPLAR